MKVRGLLAAFCAAFLAGCSLAGDITPPPGAATQASVLPSGPVESDVEVPDTSPNPQAGAVIYAEKCAPCHGERGGGDGPQSASLPVPAAALADPSVNRQAVPAEWYRLVTVGNIDRFMPGFSSLSDQERWDVVAYALTLGASPEQHAESLYGEKCAACHATGGEGREGIPALADPARMRDQSAADVFEVIVRGTGAGMPAFGSQLTEDETWALAAYVQRLAFAPFDIGQGSNSVPAATQMAPVESAQAPEATTSDVEVPPAPAAEEPPEDSSPGLGRISGTVVNGTPGGIAPPGLEVVLHALEGDQEVFSQSTSVGEDGGFRFEGVDTAPGRLYYLSAEVAGAHYESGGAHFLPDGASALEFPLVIYDTTDDLSWVRVAQLHMIVLGPEDGVLSVTEVWVMSNLGDRAVVLPEGGTLLDIVLPEGAQLLDVRGSSLQDRFALTAQGFTYSTSLVPGEGTARLAVFFDVPGERLDIRQPVTHLVDSVVILTEAAGVEVRGPGIVDQGLTEMGSRSFRQSIGGPFLPGETVEVSVSRDRFAWELLLGGTALASAAAAVGLWWVRQKAKLGAGRREPFGEVEDAGALLRRIAELDEAYEAGQLGEGEYRRRREDLKQRAMRAMRAQDD